MSNPFSQLQVYDQEDKDYQQGKNKQKKAPIKKEKDNFPVSRSTANTNDHLEPKTVKKSNKEEFNRNHRNHERPIKDIGQGHTHDRQSGTGRVDKPRKQGGGRGNLGNLHDIQNKQKYIKEGQENTQHAQQQVEVKVEQPQGKTLAEYYQSKGVQLEGPTKKEAVKKQQVNAEWIKKEKLTLLKTKEDEKNEARNKVQINRNNLQPSHANDDDNTYELLGFHSKPSAKNPKERRDEKPKQQGREYKDKHHKGGKNKEKVVINDDDFPTL